MKTNRFLYKITVVSSVFLMTTAHLVAAMQEREIQSSAGNPRSSFDYFQRFKAFQASAERMRQEVNRKLEKLNSQTQVKEQKRGGQRQRRAEEGGERKEKPTEEEKHKEVKPLTREAINAQKMWLFRERFKSHADILREYGQSAKDVEHIIGRTLHELVSPKKFSCLDFLSLDPSQVFKYGKESVYKYKIIDDIYFVSSFWPTQHNVSEGIFKKVMVGFKDGVITRISCLYELPNLRDQYRIFLRLDTPNIDRQRISIAPEVLKRGKGNAFKYEGADLSLWWDENIEFEVKKK